MQTIDFHKLGFVASHWSKTVGSIRSAEHNVKGLVNVTYEVEASGGRFVVQMMSSIFSVGTVADHAAVQPYLAKAGIRAPALVANNRGDFHWKLEGNVWRVLEYVPNDPDTLRTHKTMEEAAGMLGRLHTALSQFSYIPQFTLPGYHNPDATLDRLYTLMHEAKWTPKHELAKPLAGALRKELRRYSLGSVLNKTLLHGDPKFDNFLFRDSRAIGVLDFDTLMLGHELLDVGDALRSFCRRNGTDFDAELFRSAWQRYVHAHAISATMGEALEATMLITLDLSARYLIDSVEERYFQLKREKYKSLHDQNFTRAHRYFEYFENIRRAKVL